MRARHQDVVLLFFSERIGFLRFIFGTVDVAAVEMQMAGVDEHRACSGLVVVLRIDIACAAQEFKSLLEDLKITQVIGSLGAAGRAIAEIECDQPLHVGGVDQRAGAVGVVGIVLAVDLDGAFEVREGAGVFA